jgi:hypothetical protein
LRGSGSSTVASVRRDIGPVANISHTGFHDNGKPLREKNRDRAVPYLIFLRVGT